MNKNEYDAMNKVGDLVVGLKAKGLTVEEAIHVMDFLMKVEAERMKIAAAASERLGNALKEFQNTASKGVGDAMKNLQAQYQPSSQQAPDAEAPAT